LGADIAAQIWKWLPFWTVIFVAGRLTIPQDLNDAAEIDGATGVRRFVHVTFPLLANLYLVCTLISTIWTIGDFNSAYFVSGGSVLLGAVLLIWSLLPIYNLFLIALDPEEGEVEFTGNIYPPKPDLDAFWLVLTQSDRYLEHFWRQFGNGLEIGLLTMVLTAL